MGAVTAVTVAAAVYVKLFFLGDGMLTQQTNKVSKPMFLTHQ